MRELKTKLIRRPKALNRKAKKVYAEIRVLLVFIIAILAINTYSANAQTVEETQDRPQNEVAENIENDTQQVTQNQINQASGNPILRLEDTIRGNKEQPQVLTIVPWQLPVHQRINENTQWQLQVKPLSSIERSAFLRNLAVVNEIKQSQEETSSENID